MLHRPTAHILSTTLLFALGLWVAWLARPVLLLVVFALLVAAALAPVVSVLCQRLHLPRGLAVMLCLLGLLGVLVGAVMMLVPPLASGVDDLVAKAPQYVEELRNSRTFRELDVRYDLGTEVEEQANKLPRKLGSALGIVQAATLGILGALVQMVTVLALSAYLLLDGPRMLRFARTHLPNEHGRRMDRLVAGVRKAVSGYLLAVAALGLGAGVVAYVVLALLGVAAALPLAAVMAAGSLVPLIGAPIAAVIISVVVAFKSLQVVLIWLLVFVTYQQLENNILQPAIYRRTVALHPLVVIPAVIFGAIQLGIAGALLAVPLAACAQMAVRDWWEHRPSASLTDSPAQSLAVAGAGELAEGADAAPSGGGEPSPSAPGDTAVADAAPADAADPVERAFNTREPRQSPYQDPASS